METDDSDVDSPSFESSKENSPPKMKKVGKGTVKETVKKNKENSPPKIEKGGKRKNANATSEDMFENWSGREKDEELRSLVGRNDSNGVEKDGDPRQGDGEEEVIEIDEEGTKEKDPRKGGGGVIEIGEERTKEIEMKKMGSQTATEIFVSKVLSLPYFPNKEKEIEERINNLGLETLADVKYINVQNVFSDLLKAVGIGKLEAYQGTF